MTVLLEYVTASPKLSLGISESTVYMYHQAFFATRGSALHWTTLTRMWTPQMENDFPWDSPWSVPALE